MKIKLGMPIRWQYCRFLDWNYPVGAVAKAWALGLADFAEPLMYLLSGTARLAPWFRSLSAPLNTWQRLMCRLSVAGCCRVPYERGRSLMFESNRPNLEVMPVWNSNRSGRVGGLFRLSIVVQRVVIVGWLLIGFIGFSRRICSLNDGCMACRFSQRRMDLGAGCADWEGRQD